MREKTGTVLVVDDLADARELVSVVLSQGGYHIIEAASGMEALARLAEAPDIVVLDVHLPDIDGFEVCRRIKSNPQSATTPVVQLSAVFSKTEHRVRGLDGGADAYLTKPFEPELLRATVDALMRLRVAERQLSLSTRALRLEYELSRVLVDTVPDETVVARLLGTIAEALRAQVAELWHVAPAEDVMVREGVWYETGVAAGLEDVSADLRLRRGEGLPGRAWASGRTEWVTDLAGQLVPQRIGAVEALHLRSATVVPVIAHATLTGAVVLFHRSAARLADDLVQLADEVSRRVGLFFERTRSAQALRHAEEQLRQAQKMEAVGRLAGGIAHDFNNLLTVIGGHAQVLVSELPAGEPLRREAEAVVAATDRAAALTTGLLAFGRKQVGHARVVDLHDVIRSMSDLLQRILGEKITVAMETVPGGGRVRIDSSQLEQVIMNLAVNARDAMPDGGRLTFALAEAEVNADTAGTLKPGRHVVLSVTDTGVGMDAETRARIFEPFFTTKSVGEGTGLGLATVYAILKQHGGDVSVQSEPGKGATFRIFLPRVDAPVETVPRPVGGPSPRGTETVLLVEDADAVRQLGATVLRSLGYTVHEASNATAAMAIVQAHEGPLDLLISDVVMPGMNGPRLAERLTAVRRNLKVLYVSGYSEDALDLRARAAFLAKPYTGSQLARKVRAILDA